MPTGQRLLWRQWEGDYVIFNAASGETHILDIVSSKVFARIEKEPATTDEIYSEISNFLEVANTPELAQAVHKILTALEDSGLVEAA